MSELLPRHLRFATLPDGRRAAIYDAQIPEDAPPAVREGLARRAIVNGGGTCPCGASVPTMNRAARRAARRAGVVLHVDVEHELDCPAVTDTLRALVRAWRAGGAR